MRSFFIFIVLLFISVMVVTAEGDPWQLQLDKNNIRVYTQKREGSKIHGIKAETTFEEATFEKLKEILFDVDDLKKWVGECKDSELVEVIGEENLIYRMIIKVPFPFQDRDMVQHISVVDQTDTYLKLKLENEPDKTPIKKRIVRMPVADGIWEFEKQANGNIDAFFQYDSDPGGEIPAWLINAFLVQSPYKTLYNLRALIDEGME